MTSNQTFAGMIANWRAYANRLDSLAEYPQGQKHATRDCADEAQGLLDRLRGLVVDGLEELPQIRYADSGEGEPSGYYVPIEAVRAALDAILGPEQAGERSK